MGLTLKGVYIVKDNKHIFEVDDNTYVEGLDEINKDDVKDVCTTCKKFQKLIKAKGCDTECPIYEFGKDLIVDE